VPQNFNFELDPWFSEEHIVIPVYSWKFNKIIEFLKENDTYQAPVNLN
jgi:hypothetical protein